MSPLLDCVFIETGACFNLIIRWGKAAETPTTATALSTHTHTAPGPHNNLSGRPPTSTLQRKKSSLCDVTWLARGPTVRKRQARA